MQYLRYVAPICGTFICFCRPAESWVSISMKSHIQMDCYRSKCVFSLGFGSAVINGSGWAACGLLRENWKGPTFMSHSYLASFCLNQAWFVYSGWVWHHLDAVRKEILPWAVHGLGSTNYAACWKVAPEDHARVLLVFTGFVLWMHKAFCF